MLQIIRILQYFEEKSIEQIIFVPVQWLQKYIFEKYVNSITWKGLERQLLTSWGTEFYNIDKQ